MRRLTGYAHRFLKVVAATFAAIVLCSCEGPRIEFRLINHSDSSLEQVDVSWNRTAFSVGFLSKGSEKGLGGLPGPVPKEIRLQWVEDGTHHSESVLVEIPKVEPVRGRSTLYFEFVDSHWRQVRELP